MSSLQLGPICLKIGSGATPRGGKDVYTEAGEIALIRSQNIYNDRFSRDGLAYLSPTHAEQLRNVEVLAGDVLLNITGDSVARVCQVPDDVLPARVNQHVAIIRPDLAQLDPRFLRFFLASPRMQDLMLGLAGSGGTRNALTKGMIERFQIPAIPIEQQIEISGLLGALEDKIDLNYRMNETLEAIALAIFRNWFVDFGPVRTKVKGGAPYLVGGLWDLFPDKLDDNDMPTGWKNRPVYNIAEFSNGAAYKDMDFSPDREGFPVIKIAELKSGVTSSTKYTTSDLGAKYRIDSEEILFSWSGNPDTSIDTFVWNDGPAWLNQHIFRVRENGSAARATIYFQLKDLKPVFAEIARNKQTTGLGHVTAADMKSLMVCDSPPNIADAFEDLAGPVFEKLVSNLLENRALAKTLNLLLPKFMSGEIRVKEAGKIMAEVA